MDRGHEQKRRPRLEHREWQNDEKQEADQESRQLIFRPNIDLQDHEASIE